MERSNDEIGAILMREAETRRALFLLFVLQYGNVSGADETREIRFVKERGSHGALRSQLSTSGRTPPPVTCDGQGGVL